MTAAIVIETKPDLAPELAPELVCELAPAKTLGLLLPFGECLALPAALLSELPAPPILGLHVPGVGGVVRFDLAGLYRGAAEPGSEDGRDLIFSCAEWTALVSAIEADRVWPVDFRAFCHRKREHPEWRLDRSSALCGGQPDPAESWTVERVLVRIDAVPISIEVP